MDFMRRYYAFDQIPFDEAPARNALCQLISDQVSGVIWLICDGTTLVGYIVLTFGYSLEYHGREVFIDEFFIQPSHRGRGWGRRTLRYVEDASREFGVQAVHLEVTHANKGAQEFYPKMSFHFETFAPSRWWASSRLAVVQLPTRLNLAVRNLSLRFANDSERDVKKAQRAPERYGVGQPTYVAKFPSETTRATFPDKCAVSPQDLRIGSREWTTVFQFGAPDETAPE